MTEGERKVFVFDEADRDTQLKVLMRYNFKSEAGRNTIVNQLRSLAADYEDMLDKLTNKMEGGVGGLLLTALTAYTMRTHIRAIAHHVDEMTKGHRLIMSELKNERKDTVG